MAKEKASPLTGVLETVVYCTSETEAATRSFYNDVLRFRAIGDFSYRVGKDVFLVFNRDESTVQDEPPPHGAPGSVHVCFTASPDDYEAWKRALAEAGVQILDEITWPRNALKSFYFKDPAGNLLEIAEGDLWPP